MTALTGGLQERIKLSDISPEKLLTMLRKSADNSTLVCCNTVGQDPEIKKEGLLADHVYAVTSYLEEEVDTPLIRIRNPGGKREWNGAWSDSSEEFESIPESAKEAKFDGEFYMSIDDFFEVSFILCGTPNSFFDTMKNYFM